jgi:hypothetical protein
VAASAGVPTAVVYVVLLAVVAVAAVGVVRRPPDPVVAGAGAGLVAWVTQQVVSFPVAEVDPAAWLLAGAVTAAAAGPRRAQRAGVALRVIAALVAAVLAAGGALAVVADRHLARAARDPRSPAAAAVASADRATTLRPDDIDAWYVAARVAAARPGLLALDAGLDRVEAGLRRSPRDPALRTLRESMLVERALRSGLDADLVAAEEAAAAMVADDPAGPAHHRRLGLVLAARGDAEGATRSLTRALDLDAGDPVARAALHDLDERGGT